MVQLVKVADLAALSDQAAESLVRDSTSRFFKAVSDVFGPLVATQMSTNPTIAAAAVAAMQDAAVQAQLSFSKGTPANTVDLNTLTTPGVYGFWGSSPNSPTGASGVLFVVPVATNLVQFAFNYSSAILSKRERPAGGAWQPWKTVADGGTRGPRPLLSTTGITDLNDPSLKQQNASWGVRITDSFANMPTSGENAIIDMTNYRDDAWLMTWRSAADGYPEYRRRTVDGGVIWRDWERVGGGTGGVVSAAADEHLVRERAMMLRTGCPRVTTPGAVVLMFDHGLTKFKSTVWPLLQARGLPVTLALNPGTMGDANNSGATYADIKSWIATGRLEPANHSYDHVAIPSGDLNALTRAIRGSREELEARLELPIDTWVQNGNDMADFPVSNQDPLIYSSSVAGRLILAAHGAVAGSQSAWPAVQVRPLGVPLLGLNGTWIDNGNTATAQSAIQAAIDGGGYQIIRLHPQFLNDAGSITTAQLTAFLDWIKGKVDAGQLTALTYRQALTARHHPAT